MSTDWGLRESATFDRATIAGIQRATQTGVYDIRGWGAKRPLPHFDDLLFLGASMSRYPLEGYRERCDTDVVLGDRRAAFPLRLDIPIVIAGMSFGALSAQAKEALGRGASEVGTATTTGDGGMTPEERGQSRHLIYQYLPSRYGMNPDDLRKADAIEVVLGQGAKPGGGGMLLGQKISERVAAMRTLPAGIDQRSACRHPDWTGPDDLTIKIVELREITDWRVPVFVKIGASATVCLGARRPADRRTRRSPRRGTAVDRDGRRARPRHHREHRRGAHAHPGCRLEKPDQIRTKWISITTWIASFGGHAVLFDSTVMDHLQQGENRTSFISLDEVIAAKPEAILQNHTHLDQMRHASRIAALTGAKLMTTQGGCLFAKRDAVEKGFGADQVNCDLIMDDAGHPFTGVDTYASPYNGEGVVTTPFGTTGHPESGVPGLDISATLIKHSQLRPYPDDVSGPYVAPSPERLEYDPPNPESLADFGVTQDIDNGNMLYLVKYKDFSLAHHGSTGSLNPVEPGEAEITAALRGLGADDRVDVELGGIAELNYFANGFVESRRYSEAIGAKLLFPQHHNNWLPPVTAEAAYYYAPWTEEMHKTTVTKFPDMCFVTEDNWGTIFGYTTGKWGGDAKGDSMVTPLVGPGCYTG